VRTLGLVAAALVLTLGGCSGDDGPDEKTPDLPSQNELTAYFGAVASYDPDALGAAQAVAEEGSPAAAYLGYLGDYAASAVAAGQPVAGAEVERVDGGFSACGGTGKPDECVTWSGLQGRDGALTDFTVNGVALDDSLVDLTDQAAVTSEGLYEVQPDYAYRSPQSGTLFVTVTVTAGDVPVSPKPGIYIEQDQILNGTRTRAPATVEAGASTPVVLAFPDAQQAGLDGQVTFDLGLPGQGTQSIGFGLSAAAS
jgi:hypothetical protein